MSSLRLSLAAACAVFCLAAPANAAPAGEATAATPANVAGASKPAAASPKAASTRKGGNCQKLTFAVNDYGKDGPTRDATALLDKHVAEWTSAKGIKKFSVGKKDVSCELFLDVGLFDEHTCTASTTVCWK